MTNVGKNTNALTALAAAVASRAQVASIRLSASKVRCTVQQVDAPLKAEIAVSPNVRTKRDANKISVEAGFAIRAATADATEPQIRLDAAFIVEYNHESLEGIADDQIEAFGRVNGVYNIWPYFREFVQSMTTRMGLPPLTLPLMTGDSLIALYERQESAQQAKRDKQESDSPGPTT